MTGTVGRRIPWSSSLRRCLCAFSPTSVSTFCWCETCDQCPWWNRPAWDFCRTSHCWWPWQEWTETAEECEQESQYGACLLHRLQFALGAFVPKILTMVAENPADLLLDAFQIVIQFVCFNYTAFGGSAAWVTCSQFEESTILTLLMTTLLSCIFVILPIRPVAPPTTKHKSSALSINMFIHIHHRSCPVFT